MREFLVSFSAHSEDVHINVAFRVHAMTFSQAEDVAWDKLMAHIISTPELEHQIESIIDTNYIAGFGEEEYEEEEEGPG